MQSHIPLKLNQALGWAIRDGVSEHFSLGEKGV
jgi:hypothetical protein